MPPSQSNFARFLSALEAGKVDPSRDALADALWLGAHIARVGSGTSPTTAQSPGDPRLEGRPGVQPLFPLDADDTSVAGDAEKTDEGPPEDVSNDCLPASRIQVPGVGGIPGELRIGRALRPLMRRVPSRTHWSLDEAATAEQVAEQRLWVPVVRRRTERWLSLALVVDGHSSMLVWKPLIRDLVRLLERHGAFSDVRLWRLCSAGDATDPDGPPRVNLLARPGSSRRGPGALVDPLGRRAVWVLTDCVAPYWRDNRRLLDLLQVWAKGCPLAVIQMLPQRIWEEQTVLRSTPQVDLRAARPGLPTAALVGASTRPHGTLAVPVLALDPLVLSDWASVVAGRSRKAVRGVVLAALRTDPALTQRRPNDGDLLEDFEEWASPQAQRLAELFCNCHIALTLPAMRLVQQTLAPETSIAHLAELLLTGLITRAAPRPPNGQAPETDSQLQEVALAFLPGVRSALRERVSPDQRKEWVDRVSQAMKEHSGTGPTFAALIPDSSGDEGVSVRSDAEPFATLHGHGDSGPAVDPSPSNTAPFAARREPLSQEPVDSVDEVTTGVPVMEAAIEPDSNSPPQSNGGEPLPAPKQEPKILLESILEDLRRRLRLGEEVWQDKPYRNPANGIEYPRDFFGRQYEKKTILDYLMDPTRRQPIIVQGERRMGKSSMLRLIEEVLRSDYSHAFIVPRPIHLASCRRAATLANDLAATLASALGRPSIDVTKLGQGFHPQEAVEVFAKLLTGVHERAIVFVMDELDEFLEAENTTEQDRSTVMGMLYALRTAGLPIKLLFSMIRVPGRLRHHDEVVFVTEAKPFYLNPFEDGPDFEEMVRTLAGPDYPLTRDDVSLIHRQSGGWPFFAKAILSYLLGQPTGPGWVEAAVEQAARDVQDKRLTYAIKLMYEHHFDPDEQEVARMVAKQEGPLPLRERKWPSALLGAADRLMDRYYVQRTGDKLSFRVGLLGPWFRARRPGELPPPKKRGRTRPKRFRVAFSFSGEQRLFVEQVAHELESRFKPSQIFFDKNHEAELARIDLDTYLQDLYQNESELIVVFVSQKYSAMNWSRREWELTRGIEFDRPGAVMLVRFDETELEGVPNAGYIDIGDRGPQQIAHLIIERYARMG